MGQDEPSRIPEATAAAICDRAGPGAEARELLAEGMTPRQYLDALAGRGLIADAIRFLAFALPRREATWWACLCVAEVLGSEPTGAAAEAMEAARAWVADPSDERRRSALASAKAADIGTPAGCTAAAVFFSGGSLAPPDLDPVEPAAHVAPDLIACALTLAAVVREPEKAPEKRAAFVRTGLDVEAGRIPWPEAPRAEPAPSPKPDAGPAPPSRPLTERERRIAEMEARRTRH